MNNFTGRKSNRRVPISVLAFFILSFGFATGALAQEPAISSVTVTNDDSLQLNIGGLNLSNGGDVVATLGNFGSLSVDAESSSELVLSAAAPIPPGDYVLTVTTSTGTVKYGLTVGAAGPLAPLASPVQTNAPDDPVTSAFEGSSNTGFGTGALPGDTGLNNSAFGKNALRDNIAGGNNNTAVGATALRDNTTGKSNTASGALALQKNTTGNNNTASGVNALNSNITGTSNTASGKGTLSSNTTGNFNTASGVAALESNTTGDSNTASGRRALTSNTTGSDNTASGAAALLLNTTGSRNTASGVAALIFNTTGGSNTASGVLALNSNTSGSDNTASGYAGLFANTTGIANTASGIGALSSNTTGSNNIALGKNAGSSLTVGNDNIAIGNPGVVGEAATTRIGTTAQQTRAFMAGIANTDLSADATAPVVVKPDGQLGTGAGIAGGCTSYSNPGTYVGMTAIQAANFGGQAGADALCDSTYAGSKALLNPYGIRWLHAQQTGPFLTTHPLSTNANWWAEPEGECLGTGNTLRYVAGNCLNWTTNASDKVGALIRTWQSTAPPNAWDYQLVQGCDALNTRIACVIP